MDIDSPPPVSFDEALGPLLDFEPDARSYKDAKLPAELCDLIIDCVETVEYEGEQKGADSKMSDDKEPTRREDLFACMLACKRFVPRARAHLYKQLELNPGRSASKCEAVYDPSRVGLYVSEVLIRDEEDRSGDSTEDDMDVDMGNASVHWLTHLVPMLRGLDNVKTMYWHNLKWCDLGRDTRAFLLEHFSPKVTKFLLSSVDFFNSNQAFRVLQAFHNVADLSLCDLRWEYPNHTRAQISDSKPLNLDHIQIFDEAVSKGIRPWTVTILQWLLSARSLLRVREASFTWAHPYALPLFLLLWRLLPALESLEIEFDITNYLPVRASLTKNGDNTWKHDAEFYNLDDDEADPNLDGDHNANSAIHHQIQRRAQLEREAKYWIDEDDAYVFLTNALDRRPWAQAPMLQHTIVTVVVCSTAAIVDSALCWITSIAPRGMSLEFRIDMRDGGVEYSWLAEMDECLARHLDQWRADGSEVALKIRWPEGEEDYESGGMLYSDYLRGQLPRLAQLGLPFRDNCAGVKFPGTQHDGLQGPLSWIEGSDVWFA
ncbi:hypothetical protein OBBRIDRAFT_838603 [Obba rivulosa]|uniref:Uncharacterized protein n=1 Tax=Obba rivulosa TaxID=1052685 RepID=A0A8E2DFE4_9APHY|nr:hypothetical protein OBBRIDRAFT_838603 [Obba rivulosa]